MHESPHTTPFDLYVAFLAQAVILCGRGEGDESRRSPLSQSQEPVAGSLFRLNTCGYANTSLCATNPDRSAMKTVLLLLATLWALPATAQTGPDTCSPGFAQADLDISGVRARLFNSGNLFWKGDPAIYEVPKNGGASAIFTAGIWLGGTLGGDLRVAAARYGDYEFYPGPLADAAAPPADCSFFDRIYTVSIVDVETYEDTGTASDDLRDWPVEIGAPVIDGDGISGNYDLAGGDRPDIRGSQTAFWVMHDAGPHPETGSEPLGVEVQVLAWSIVSESLALHQATFYEYRIANRNDQAIEDLVFTFFSDLELGNYFDDYIGSDPGRNMVFVYNGDNEDETQDVTGYGNNPPALGVRLLGATAGSVVYYNNSQDPSTGDPQNAAEYRNYMTGNWKDGEPFTYGGQGRGGAEPSPFVYPSEPGTYWSELCLDPDCTEENIPGDRRGLISTVPERLEAGESKTYTLALAYGRGADHLASVGVMKAASDEIQAAFDAGTLSNAVPVPVIVLDAPGLVSPAEGSFFNTVPPVLEWTAQPQAESYFVEIGLDPGLSDAVELRVWSASAVQAPELGPQETTSTLYWRVRAERSGVQGPASETRSYEFYNLYNDQEPGFLYDGAGIVEVASPGVEDVCAGAPADPGCALGLGGNTVFADPNSTGSYSVLPRTSLSLSEIERSMGLVQPEDYEMRFTQACANDSTPCYGVYATNFAGDGTITRVPFEAWQIGPNTTDDPGDDVRMIPIVRRQGDASLSDWTDAFPGVHSVAALPITDTFYLLMPDREEGYAAFAAQAEAFGGAGATWDPDADGDDQDDINCSFGGYYIDFCWRDRGPRSYPVGNAVLADLNGDGLTPPVGTVIRFRTTYGNQQVATEDAPSSETASALGVPYPNPVSGRITVPFALAEAGRVRLTIVDVLGREVAVAVDGMRPARADAATVDASRFAPGLYLVVLETEAGREARRFTVVR